MSLKYPLLRVKAKVNTNYPSYGLSIGDEVEGYINNWYTYRDYTMQIELSESINVEGCSGIIIANVSIDKDSIEFPEYQLKAIEELIRQKDLNEELGTIACEYCTAYIHKSSMVSYLENKIKKFEKEIKELKNDMYKL